MGAPLSGMLQRIGENELTGVSAYPDWRQEAERLTAAGEAILSGKETYGVHLERLVTARTLMTRALSALREAIRVDDKELAVWQARELRRLQNRRWVGPRFASDDGHAPDPARAMSSGASHLCRRHSPGSEAPSAISSAGRTTKIGCGMRGSRGRSWSARGN